MTEIKWQKARRYEQGTEIPRGPVRLSIKTCGDWLESVGERTDWEQVNSYRLPATDEGRKEADRIRKANYRAELGRTVVLPLPDATAAALTRVCGVAEIDDRRELLATLVHRLDELDSRVVRALLTRDRPQIDVSHLLHLIGGDVPAGEEYRG